MKGLTLSTTHKGNRSWLASHSRWVEVLGGSQWVSAKTASSGTRSKAPRLAMRAMTEDCTLPQRLTTV